MSTKDLIDYLTTLRNEDATSEINGDKTIREVVSKVLWMKGAHKELTDEFRKEMLTKMKKDEEDFKERVKATLERAKAHRAGAGAGAGSCDKGECHLRRGWRTDESEALDTTKKFCSVECAEKWVAETRAELRRGAGGATVRFDALCDLSGHELAEWIDEHEESDPLLFVAQRLVHFNMDGTEVSDEMRWELFYEMISQPIPEGDDY